MQYDWKSNLTVEFKFDEAMIQYGRESAVKLPATEEFLHLLLGTPPAPLPPHATLKSTPARKERWRKKDSACIQSRMNCLSLSNRC